MDNAYKLKTFISNNYDMFVKQYTLKYAEDKFLCLQNLVIISQTVCQKTFTKQFLQHCRRGKYKSYKDMQNAIHIRYF